MNQTHQQIAEAFSKHDFARTYPSLSDATRWHQLGQQVLVGRQRIMAACDQSRAYLNGVTTTQEKFVVVSGPNHVVIESVTAYVDAQQRSSKVASCDSYRFEAGILIKIRSYTVELT